MATIGGAQVQNQYGSGITTDGTNFAGPNRSIGGAVTSNGMITQNGATPIATPSAPEVIDANLIGSTSPLVVPKIPQSTAAQGISGIVDGMKQSSLNSALDQKEKDAASAKNTSEQDYKSIIDEIAGIQGNQATAESQAGLPQKAQFVTDATNKIEASQRAQLNELRAIDQQPGISAEGAAIQKAAINRRYAYEQADLALIQSAANRDFETAQSIVERKTQLALEPLKTRLDYVKSLYEDNKDTLSKADDRKLQAAITEAEREYKTKENFEKQKNDFAMQALKDGNTTLFKAINGAQDSNGIANAIVNSSKSTIPSTVAPAAQKALSVILGSSKFSKEQKLDLTNAINNGEDPFTVIKNQTKNIMGQTLATDLDKYETAKSQLESIDSLLDAYYTAGGKTGIFKGNLESTLNKLGQVNDSNLVSIATNIASALQIYRNAVSGTAYSVQEGADIASIFPGINKSEGLNDAIIKGRLQAFDSTIDSKYRNTLGKTYDELKGATAPVKRTEEESKKKLFAFADANPAQRPIIQNILSNPTPLFGNRVPTYTELNDFYKIP